MEEAILEAEMKPNLDLKNDTSWDLNCINTDVKVDQFVDVSVYRHVVDFEARWHQKQIENRR